MIAPRWRVGQASARRQPSGPTSWPVVNRSHPAPRSRHADTRRSREPVEPRFRSAGPRYPAAGVRHVDARPTSARSPPARNCWPWAASAMTGTRARRGLTCVRMSRNLLAVTTGGGYTLPNRTPRRVASASEMGHEQTLGLLSDAREIDVVFNPELRAGCAEGRPFIVQHICRTISPWRSP
jgi:hypothetical protein